MRFLQAPMGVTPKGSRMWLRWVVLAIFVLTLGVAFVNLGHWQLDRLEQRRDRNQSVQSHEQAPVVDFAEVFNQEITDGDQWQRVRVSGEFDATTQFLVRYRSQGGDSGYEVVTPLHTTDGRWVLIDRGFGIKTPDQDYPSVLPAPPEGVVELTGYVRRNEVGSSPAMTPTQGTIRLVNSTVLAEHLGRELVNGFISVLEMTPPDPANLTPVQPPVLDEGNHFSYALQWFFFAGLAGAGLIVLIGSDYRAARKRKADAARKDQGDK